MYGDSVVVGTWEAFLEADETEEDDPIPPSGVSLDFPVSFESLSAPADFVELGLTWLRNGVEWALGSDLENYDLCLKKYVLRIEIEY